MFRIMCDSFGAAIRDAYADANNDRRRLEQLEKFFSDVTTSIGFSRGSNAHEVVRGVVAANAAWQREREREFRARNDGKPEE